MTDTSSIILGLFGNYLEIYLIFFSFCFIDCKVFKRKEIRLRMINEKGSEFGRYIDFINERKVKVKKMPKKEKRKERERERERN